ncbi:MAG: sulfite exporter TauE/SafE family protein [Intrasporangium sp.]|uniref:sulfite exporter TauE/SafE family protein n=1 Tax=Intrasporangium sp. TaxID=1925024 RepID=UPI00264947AE|nr:sulfite exporter TauE/SafE family protein [Intrasporangium sp.]MDN5797036.1 sulfite exporter TauE/SafE family protein [Intrasporangium sp.]
MTTWLLAPLVGLVVGLVMGGLGGGGAVLSVPVLVYVLGQPAHPATTISLVVVLFGAFVGLVSMRGSGRVAWRTGLVFGGLGIAGSIAGARLSYAADARLLLGSFAVLLAAVAVLMWRSADRDQSVSTGPGDVSVGKLVPTALGIGALTGFFGVGGGFATVPALALVMRMPPGRATATSLVVICVNSVAALLTRIAGKGVSGIPWLLVLTFAVGTGVGTSLGTRVSGRLHGAHLMRAFAVFLVVIAVVVGVQTALA